LQANGAVVRSPSVWGSTIPCEARHVGGRCTKRQHLLENDQVVFKLGWRKSSTSPRIRTSSPSIPY
jgi:hypothetical protein